MKNEITTTHSLDFIWQPAPRSDIGLLLFRVGTCRGQWRSQFDAYEIVSVINDQPGNGHFEDVLQWFEQSCRRDGKSLRFEAMMNDRLTKHLIEKRGFKPLVLEKEFEETKPIKQLYAEHMAKLPEIVRKPWRSKIKNSPAGRRRSQGNDRAVPSAVAQSYGETGSPGVP